MDRTRGVNFKAANKTPLPLSFSLSGHFRCKYSTKHGNAVVYIHVIVRQHYLKHKDFNSAAQHLGDCFVCNLMHLVSFNAAYVFLLL